MRYNAAYANGEPNMIATLLVNTQQFLEGEPDDTWNPEGKVVSNYTEYFQSIGDTIEQESEQYAAMWVDAEQDEKD